MIAAIGNVDVSARVEGDVGGEGELALVHSSRTPSREKPGRLLRVDRKNRAHNGESEQKGKNPWRAIHC